MGKCLIIPVKEGVCRPIRSPNINSHPGGDLCCPFSIGTRVPGGGGRQSNFLGFPMRTLSSELPRLPLMAKVEQLLYRINSGGVPLVEYSVGAIEIVRE